VRRFQWVNLLLAPVTQVSVVQGRKKQDQHDLIKDVTSEQPAENDTGADGEGLQRPRRP
jgi:hypothetical protein